MSKYNLDIDYLIPQIEICITDLEEIIMEAEIESSENKKNPEKLGMAWLRKAQALQMIQEIRTHFPIFRDSEKPPKSVYCKTQNRIKIFIDKALICVPDMPEAIMQMGKVYHNLAEFDAGLFDEAIKWYNRAIRLKPDYAAAFKNRGGAYRKQNKFKEAIADFTEAIRLRPTDATYYFSRGNTYSQMGEHEKAIADFTSVITHGEDEYKMRTGIFSCRGEEYEAINECEMAQCDFDTNTKIWDDFNNLFRSFGRNLIAADNEFVKNKSKEEKEKVSTCFLCKRDVKTVNSLWGIGSDGLMMCSDCVKNITLNKVSAFGITKLDIKKLKKRVSENKKLEKNSLEYRSPEIKIKTMSETKKIRYCEYSYKEDEKRAKETASLCDRMFPNEPISERDNYKKDLDKKANDPALKNKSCFVCKRNCYVTKLQFMVRNRLWICPDCLKNFELNNEEAASHSITSEEIAECKKYLDIRLPEGKKAHSLSLPFFGDLTMEKIKIVSWNCHYGFDRKKASALRPYNADILVIPECREMDMDGSGYDAEHRIWYGDHKEATDENGNVNKEKDLGIGVFWKDGIKITPLPEWENTLCKNSDFRYLVPFSVAMENFFDPFTLIAVWTKDKNIAGTSDTLAYVEKAHAAIDQYTRMGLLNSRVVLIGDFNSNVIWDDRYPKGRNHSALVEKLKQRGIPILDCSTTDGWNNFSTYCYYTETGEKRVIDDYCFASKDMMESVSFSVPDASDWKLADRKKRWNGSDHCPIYVELEFKAKPLFPAITKEEIPEYVEKLWDSGNKK